MRALLLIFCGLLSSAAMASDHEYWLTRGTEWKGVKIGDQTVRTRDSLCREQRCYVLTDVGSPVSDTMRHYGLHNVEFDALSKIAIDKKGDNKIRLPDDLGQELFLRALRADRKDTNKIKEWPRSD